MKNLAIVLLVFQALILGGCLQSYVDNLPIEEPEKVADTEFEIDVPADFDWSLISRSALEINIISNGNITAELDGTLIELYDQDDFLLDALTISDGTVVFNVGVPTSTTRLKIKSEASNVSKEFSPEEGQVNLIIPDISAMNFERIDKDNDGLFDKFDAFPENPNKAISINHLANDNNLKSGQGKSTSSSVYTIFEDLWPSKGDYDFNDLVVKAEFSWERGKSNYITEITATINVENIGAGLGLGLGYELFKVNGTNLTYMSDIINGVSGSGSKDGSVTNGIIVFSKVQLVGTTELNFTVELDEKEIKDFLFVPYLFRTDDVKHQVRPYGAPPTANQDMALFNTSNDASPKTWWYYVGKKFKYPLKENEAFYRTVENHPWGIEFISKSRFKPSNENKSILRSYPDFKNWVETSGSKNQSWYENPE